MKLTREQIVKSLTDIVGKERVITDEEVLKASSIDRFRKYESICGVFTQPIPAAVVEVKNAGEVSKILMFMNENKLNAVPRTGASATEGGLETAVENSVVID